MPYPDLLMSVRVAMWSGPRNISTAMMRSWGARPDTFVCDEPLYAHYLTHTGIQHPGREETLATMEHDWRKAVDWLTGTIPEGKTVFYQKQMAHHLVGDIELDWAYGLTNCFLIREPREMITSLLEFVPEPGVSNTGLDKQVEIFEMIRVETSEIPPVIDARDVLDNPRGVLSKLCERIGLPFYEEMLEWPPGPRDTDGAWAKYWYKKVEQTTSFGPYRPKPDPVPESLMPLLAECEELYERLRPYRITA